MASKFIFVKSDLEERRKEKKKKERNLECTHTTDN